MTPDQLTAITDTIMFASGMIAAAIFAVTWKG